MWANQVRAQNLASTFNDHLALLVWNRCFLFGCAFPRDALGMPLQHCKGAVPPALVTPPKICEQHGIDQMQTCFPNPAHTTQLQEVNIKYIIYTLYIYSINILT